MKPFTATQVPHSMLSPGPSTGLTALVVDVVQRKPSHLIDERLSRAASCRLGCASLALSGGESAQRGSAVDRLHGEVHRCAV